MNIKLLLATLLATGVASAATPVDGWYTSAFGGYTFLPDNVNAAVDGLIFNGTSYNNGYNVGGRVGYQNKPMRYELEYTYFSASNTGFMANWVEQTAGITGSSSGNLFMANLYYDFPDMLPAISPFLGLGIGFAQIETTLISSAPLDGAYFSASEIPFAYQGTAGLTYNFSENYALNLSYRYVATGKSGEFGRVFQAHLANVGAIYRFDQGNYK